MENLRVGAQSLEELTHFKPLVEEHVDQSSDRMIHSLNVRSLRLDRHVMGCFSQTALFGCEGVCKQVVEVEIKLFVTEIDSETEMVRMVGVDTLNLGSKLDAHRSIFLDLGKPLVKRDIQVVLEHAEHNLEPFFEEEM